MRTRFYPLCSARQRCLRDVATQNAALIGRSPCPRFGGTTAHAFARALSREATFYMYMPRDLEEAIEEPAASTICGHIGIDPSLRIVLPGLR